MASPTGRGRALAGGAGHARQPIVSERRTAWQRSIMLDSTTGTSDHAVRHLITLTATSGHFSPDGGRPFPSRCRPR